MKSFLNIISWILPALAIFFGLAFTHSAQQQKSCNSFSVSIDYGTDAVNYMITADEIREQLFSACESPVGKSYAEIDIETYEKTLKTISYVADADACLSIDGNMFVRVKQRTPLIRIHGIAGNPYYLDKDGVKMPLSAHRSAHVMLGGGFILDSLLLNYTKPLKDADKEIRKSRLYAIYTIAKYINSDEFLNALISQIYVDENGEIQLIPRLGRHYIILGDTNAMQERFDKLKQFYHSGITKAGWDKYKVINIGFTDQVICTLK